MVEALDRRETGLETVPLRLVLGAALGFGYGVGERGVVLRDELACRRRKASGKYSRPRVAIS
jgi:hypothetical protein